MKLTHCRVAESMSDPSLQASQPVTYELPDLSTITLESERFKVPEYMFQTVQLGSTTTKSIK